MNAAALFYNEIIARFVQGLLFMRLNKILQKDYTLSFLCYQIKLPLDVERRIKKKQATPRQLFKLMVYASMNRIYSSRDIETACCRDINFMYLLEGNPVPDHATFARFISVHFAQCSKKTLAEVSKLLYSLGEISGKSIFIDRGKIESAANKYTFVWKKLLRKIRQNFLTKSLSL